MRVSNRWEHGSEFQWLADWTESPLPMPWGEKNLFFGSGRHAFRALLSYGIFSRNWRRLWVPSYFCQDVVESFISTNIKVTLYQDSPWNVAPRFDQIDFRSGDVLLLVNYFGLRAKNRVNGNYPSDIEIIENHTHDPWSDWARTSTADWCIASLRKTLPLPGGAVLWSPAGHHLRSAVPVTPVHLKASLEKFAAMVLKSWYLQGYPIEKETFRRLAISGEQHIASGKVSGMPEWTKPLLSAFPVAKWRDRKRLNHQVLSAALADLPWVDVLQAERYIDTCPFSGILVFDSAKRQLHVKGELSFSRIYPAILWQLDKPMAEGISQRDLDFSRRMLSIHCDMRYDENDMNYVASLIREYGEANTI